MKIRIRRADSFFSRYIRTRDKWTCQRCGSKHQPGTKGLHCAHMFTRRNESTRFDEANCCALDYGCHAYLDSHPVEKVDFFKRRLGEAAFNALRVRTNTFAKRDDKLVVAWCQEMLRRMDATHQG